MRQATIYEDEVDNISDNEDVRISRFALRMLLLLAVLILLFSPFIIQQLRELSFQTLAMVSVVVVLTVMILAVRMTARHIWSVFASYLLIFSLFHFGAIFVHGLGISFAHYYARYFSQWLFNDFSKEALILALIGFVSCFLGVHIAFVIRPTFTKPAVQEIGLSHLLNRNYSLAGSLLLTFGIASWFLFIFVLIEDPGLLLGSYEDYRIATGQFAFLIYSNYAIALGLPLLASGKFTRLHLWGYALFGIWTLFAFPIGLRGEVLFPLVAAAVVAARNGYLISLRRTLFFFLLLLTIITAARQIRQVGLRDIYSQQIDWNPANALAEMGTTLRAVSETVKWRVGGDEFIYGASYWAPVERLVLRFIPGSERPKAIYDDRLMNVLVMKRVGPIGYSPVAEAYRNFNTIGVFAIMLLTGVLLGRMDLWPLTPFRNSLLVAIFVPLLAQIRNDFTPVPFRWLVGISLVVAIYIATKLFYDPRQD